VYLVAKLNLRQRFFRSHLSCQRNSHFRIPDFFEIFFAADFTSAKLQHTQPTFWFFSLPESRMVIA
jgi:hypothetical protein